jgi:hypothetical protein
LGNRANITIVITATTVAAIISGTIVAGEAIIAVDPARKKLPATESSSVD